MQRSLLLPLLCAPGLLGCATEPLDVGLEPLTQDQDLVTSPAVGERAAQVQADLDLLAALEVFAVGNLLARYPVGALNCYGVCPDLEAEVALANERAGERLASLTERATTAITSDAGVEPGACEQATIDANLEALRALEVVEVGEFLVVVPDNNPLCYNLPCGEDIAAAEQETCERAAALARIISEL